MGLSVNKERDHTLEALIWELWLDLEKELKERVPFSPIMELLNDADASSQLVAPVPQLTLPANAPGANFIQADVNTISGKCIDVKPVDFEQVNAIMESSRLAQRSATRGKILASRQPDLNIQYNCLVSFRGWENSPS